MNDGEGQAHALRYRTPFFFGRIVLGPLGPEENKRRFSVARAIARDRPSPYGEGGAFLRP